VKRKGIIEKKKKVKEPTLQKAFHQEVLLQRGGRGDTKVLGKSLGIEMRDLRKRKKR